MVKVVSLIFLFIPSMVISEVGFRDLNVGQPSTVIDEHCHLQSEMMGRKKYHCYDNKDYDFEFEITDTQIISSVDIGSTLKTDFDSSFYSDKSSKFWEMRQNFFEKYEYVKCEDRGFKKLILGEDFMGTEFFVNFTSNNELIWIMFSVVQRGNSYFWGVKYLDDNYPTNPTYERYTDFFMKLCGLTDFKTDDF